MKYDRHQDSPTSNASPESSIAAQYTPLFYKLLKHRGFDVFVKKLMPNVILIILK